MSDAADDHWNAALYARHSTLQEAMAAQALALVALDGDEAVLDVGCGDGRVTARIAEERVPRGRVLGVDASPDMIAFARRAHAGLDRLRFAVADARNLGFEQAFDAAVSFNALHWMHDVTPALRSLRVALRDGGRAWLRLVTLGTRTSLETVAERVRREPAWAASFSGFKNPYLQQTADAVRASAEAARFEVRDANTRLEGWDFATREAFLGFCNAGFGAWTARLEADRRDAFVEEVLDRYLQLRASGEPEFLFRFYQTDLTLVAV